MAEDIEPDEELLEKAIRLGALRTKSEAVNVALEEYVQRREQLKVMELFGTVDLDPDHDYKASRRGGESLEGR